MSDDTILRKIRIDRGISGTDVAKHLDISPQYYYDIEKGKRRLKSDIALKLAEYFGVEVGELLKIHVEKKGIELISAYNELIKAQEELEKVKENKNNSDSHKESELSEIPIEKLNSFKLTYKGKKLSSEEANDVVEMLEAALKRWK